MTVTPNCQIIEAAVLAEFPDAQFGRYNCRHIGSNPLRSWSQHAGSEPARSYFGNALDISHQAFGSTVTVAHTVWLRKVYALLDSFGIVDQLLGPGDAGHANHVHVSTWPKMKSNFWYQPPCKGGTLIVIYEDGTTGDTFGDAVPPPPPPRMEALHMAYADTLTLDEWVSTLRPADIDQLFALGVHTGNADHWKRLLAAHPNPPDAGSWENFRRTTSARIGFWQPEGAAAGAATPSSYQITGDIVPT